MDNGLLGVNWRRLIAKQVRSLGLLAVLCVVFLAFQVLTKGLFLTPRNLTVLSVQMAITAILAAGIVMVMVPGLIDLSIGATVAFCAITAAVAMSRFGASVWTAIALTVVVGTAIGAWHGFCVAWMNVPAFIVTLASLMALRGSALLVTEGRTIAPGGNITFIADFSIPVIGTAVILVALWMGFTSVRMRERAARLAAAIETPLLSSLMLPVGLLGALCIAGITVALSYRGMPLPVAILLVVAAGITFTMRQTRFGRHLYALGGNPEAARLAGISRQSHAFWVFLVMGVLYGVAGLIFVSRLNSAPPNGAIGLELNVIAAAVIGGTSLFGGIGSVIGAVMGALLMESLNNGMSLMNLPSYYQQIVVGLVLLLAVYFDLRSRGAN
jgi:ABC-type xylose transport system permease subunit